jgi:hypothetical protein
MAVMAIWGAGVASATELYKYTTPSANDTLGAGTELSMSMKSGTSMILRDQFTQKVIGTCTRAELQGKTETAGGEAAHPSGSFSAVSLTNCTHTTHMVANGGFEIQHLAGTTNGTVAINGLKFKIKDTIFGLECTVALSGTVGTLTGATSATGTATLDIVKALVSWGLCGTAELTATFSITTPTGLIVEAK